MDKLVIPAQYNQWVDPNFDSFKNIDSLKKYMQDVKYKTEDYLSKLSLKKINKQIVIPWGDKPDTKISIETALYHMVLEDMIHYGELSAMLWQMNLEAPYLGFWRYKHIHP